MRLLPTIPGIRSARVIVPDRLFPCLSAATPSKRHVTEGARQRRDHNTTWDGVFGGPKIRLSRAGDGRRGRHERSRASGKFISFILCSFQPEFDFLQAVAISACRGVGRYVQQCGNFLEGVAVPDLEHDHLALLNGEFGQTPHGRPFAWSFPGRRFEPAPGLQFPPKAAPQRTVVVHRAVSKRSHAIVLRLKHLRPPLHQGNKCVLQHILRLGMTQTQSSAV
jgi:hypothetical protein